MKIYYPGGDYEHRVTSTPLILLTGYTLMGGSMKKDRDVMELARGKLSVNQIAAKLKITPQAVFKIGRRLGVYFPPLELKRNGRRKPR